LIETLVLSLLTVFLAAIGLWERFPRGAPLMQRLALAGSLLALLLMFFFGFNRIERAIADLKKDVGIAVQEAQIKILKTAPDSPGATLYDLLYASNARLIDLYVKKDGRLYQDEGIRFLAKALRREMKKNAKNLRVVAVSTDPEEFSRSAAFTEYEAALAEAVNNMIPVERIYVLPDTTFSRLKKAWERPALETGGIEQNLKELGLNAVLKHYRARLQCNFTPMEVLEGRVARDYDFMIVLRGEVLFAANRTGDDQLRIVLQPSDDTHEWLTRFASLNEDPKTHKESQYQPPTAARATDVFQ